MKTTINGYTVEIDSGDQYITKGAAFASLSVLIERGSLDDLIPLDTDTLSEIQTWFADTAQDDEIYHQMGRKPH